MQNLERVNIFVFFHQHLFFHLCVKVTSKWDDSPQIQLNVKVFLEKKAWPCNNVTFSEYKKHNPSGKKQLIAPICCCLGVGLKRFRKSPGDLSFPSQKHQALLLCSSASSGRFALLFHQFPFRSFYLNV